MRAMRVFGWLGIGISGMDEVFDSWVAVLESIGASVSVVVLMTLSRGLVIPVSLLTFGIFNHAIRFGNP